VKNATNFSETKTNISSGERLQAIGKMMKDNQVLIIAMARQNFRIHRQHGKTVITKESPKGRR
jgi:hypothetical protein